MEGDIENEMKKCFFIHRLQRRDIEYGRKTLVRGLTSVVLFM